MSFLLRNALNFAISNVPFCRISNFVSILYYRLERIATNLRIFVYSAKIPLPEEGERLKSAEGKEISR
jgi:hypothetical protein